MKVDGLADTVRLFLETPDFTIEWPDDLTPSQLEACEKMKHALGQVSNWVAQNREEAIKWLSTQSQ